MEELERLERVKTKSDKKRYTLATFIVCAYTGMRISDAEVVTSENISEGFLSYVSIKTGIHATSPCTERIAGYINYIRTSGVSISLAGRNKAIQTLCKRADITELVKIHRAEKILSRKSGSAFQSAK